MKTDVFEVGDLRVYHIPSEPGEEAMKPSFQVNVETIKEAKLLLQSLYRYDCYLYEQSLTKTCRKEPFSGLEIFDDGEWREWEDKNGFPIESTEE